MQDKYLSHSYEPDIGDHVVNTNPGCKHAGSQGIVLDIISLPEQTGKTVCYKCLNSGPSWYKGEVLEKTMDQLSPIAMKEFRLRRFLKNLLEDKDQNKDGENDFDDVKIARMKASGMSDAEIKKKHPELFESDTPHLKQYSAPQGSKRDKQLDATKADLKSGDPERVARAYRRRERMEKKASSSPGFKNKPRKDTKKESDSMTEAALREFVREVLYEKLSKKTKETLKKKAKKRGLTPSSVYAEFRKGLAAWASSGSRKGMSQHQWAHARVNSATPSKSWAVVKKAKKKKKKKKK